MMPRARAAPAVLALALLMLGPAFVGVAQTTEPAPDAQDPTLRDNPAPTMPPQQRLGVLDRIAPAAPAEPMPARIHPHGEALPRGDAAGEASRVPVLDLERRLTAERFPRLADPPAPVVQLDPGLEPMASPAPLPTPAAPRADPREALPRVDLPALPPLPGVTYAGLDGGPCTDTPLSQLPPGLLFLVVTEVPGQAPRVTPALPLIKNPVHADAPVTGGTGDPTGLDLLLSVNIDLTLSRITLLIERPPTADLPGPLAFKPLPALDVRIVVPLTGGPEPGLFDQGCQRDFVYAGYRYADPAGQPDVFAVTVDFADVSPDDTALELSIELEQPPQDLSVLGGLYTANTAQGPRDASLDVSALLQGLPDTLEALARVRSIAAGTSNTTAVDWRADAALAGVEVRMDLAEGGDSQSTLIDIAGMPRRANAALAIGADTAVTYDASAAIPDLVLAMDTLEQGTVVERVRAHATQVPAHAIVVVEPLRMTYAGDTPLGLLDLVRGTFAGPFLRLPGEHVAVFDNAVDSSVSVVISGLQLVEFDTSSGLGLEARVGGGMVFDVLLDLPDLFAQVTIDALPSVIQVKSDLAGDFHYRASSTIALITGQVLAPPLSVAFTLNELPKSVDLQLDTALGQASLVLDTPLGGAAIEVVNEDGFTGMPYERLRVLVQDLPGLAANWSSDGKRFAVQALPPGAGIGRVEVELSNTSNYIGFASPFEHAASIEDFPGAERASLQVLDFAAASADLTQGVDLRFVTGQPHPLRLRTDDPAKYLEVDVEDLPASVRFISDLNTTFAYNASHPIASLHVFLEEKAPGNTTTVEVRGLPERFTVLLDQEGGAASFDPGPKDVLGSVDVLLERPAGVSPKLFEYLHVRVEQVPALNVRWSGSGARFATDGRALGLASASISTSALPPLLPADLHAGGDYVVLRDNTTGPGSLHIDARIRGLLFASADYAEGQRVLGEVRLSQPRHFDVLIEKDQAGCRAQDISLHVHRLPSFSVDTDMDSMVHYHASAPIEDIDLTIEQEARFLGLCLLQKRMVAAVDDLPEDLDIRFTTTPLDVVFRASAPITAVDVDILDLTNGANEVQRIIARTTGIPATLHAGFDAAEKSAILSASSPVGEIEVIAAKDPNPSDPLLGYAQPHVVHLDTFEHITQEMTVALRITGLREASFAMADTALAGKVDAFAGPLVVDIKEEHITDDPGDAEQSEILVEVNDFPGTLEVTTDGASVVRLAMAQAIAEVIVTSCDDGFITPNVADTCARNLIAVDLTGVPPVVDLQLTALGFVLGFGGQQLGGLGLLMQNPRGLFDDEAPGSIELIRANVAPVPEGHIKIGDPHDIDVQFADDVRVNLRVSTDIGEDPPAGQVLQAGNPFFANGHIYIWTENAPGAGEDAPDEIVDIVLGAAAGQGIRGARIMAEGNPTVVDLAFDLPGITVAQWKSNQGDGATYPDMLVLIDDPPPRLHVEVEERHPSYLLNGYAGATWRWDDYYVVRQNGGPAPSPGATNSVTRLDTRGTGIGGLTQIISVTPTGGDFDFTPPGGGTSTPNDKLSIKDLIFEYLPESIVIESASDPRVYDNQKGHDGTYSATDLNLGPSRVGVDGLIADGSKMTRMVGDLSRLFTDDWKDYDQDLCDFLGSIPNEWVHIRADAHMGVDDFKEYETFWDPTGPFTNIADFGNHDFEINFDDFTGTLWLHLGEEACDNGQSCQNSIDGWTQGTKIDAVIGIDIDVWDYDDTEDDCEGTLLPDGDLGDGDTVNL